MCPLRRWSDLHSICQASVAANWISLDVQCWANRLVAADGLFTISVAFSEAGAREESYRAQADIIPELPLSIQYLSFTLHPLFTVSSTIYSPSFHYSPRGASLSFALILEVKRWSGENEVSWFWCFVVSDGKLQCSRQWLEACCTSARGSIEQKRGGWKRLHHQLAPVLITLT